MDLLNMTNREQIHEFYKKVKQRKLLFFKLISGLKVMEKYKLPAQYL